MAADETRCCATCGFMGLKRLRGGSGILDEVGQHYRDTGQCDYGIYDGSPSCGESACDLREETSAAARALTGDRSGNGRRPDAVLQVIRAKRDACPWTPWRPGSTPVEHRTMIHDEAVLALQRSAVALQREMLDVQKAVLDLRKAVEANTESRHGRNLFFQFLFAMLAAVVTLLGAKLLPWF